MLKANGYKACNFLAAGIFSAIAIRECCGMHGYCFGSYLEVLLARSAGNVYSLKFNHTIPSSLGSKLLPRLYTWLLPKWQYRYAEVSMQFSIL